MKITARQIERLKRWRVLNESARMLLGVVLRQEESLTDAEKKACLTIPAVIRELVDEEMNQPHNN